MAAVFAGSTLPLPGGWPADVEPAEEVGDVAGRVEKPPPEDVAGAAVVDGPAPVELADRLPSEVQAEQTASSAAVQIEARIRREERMSGV